MANIFLKQAICLLNESGLDETIIKNVQTELLTIEKTAGLSPELLLTNAISLLTPFVVNYKVNQVLKLLNELVKDSKKFDPATGLRTHI